MIEIKITDRMPLEKAMKIMKKKLVKSGFFKELRGRRYYEKPSRKKKRKSDEALRLKNKNRGRKKKKFIPTP